MSCIVFLLGGAVLEVSMLVDKDLCINIIPFIDERFEGKQSRARKRGETGGAPGRVSQKLFMGGLSEEVKFDYPKK